jgi:hypothetical protein
MSSDLNNNSFEELIRNKLEDHRTLVEPNNWDAIERSLLRNKRLKYIYTATVVAAAAVAILLIILNLPGNDNQWNDNLSTVIPRTDTLSTTKPDKQNVEPAPDAGKQTAQKTTASPTRQTPDNQTEQKQSASISTPAFNAATNSVTAQAGAPDTNDTNPEDPPLKNRLILVPTTISGTSTSISPSNKLQFPNDTRVAGALNVKRADKKSNNNIRPDDRKDLIASLDKNRTDSKKWSVLMSFGAGNYQAPTVNTKNSDLMMAAPLLTSSSYSVDYVRNKYRDEVKVPDNADLQHGLPLSAKFIVRKDFNARWAVESGLSYTYLSTKYKWNQNSVNQQLHYLGIPLNAVCYVVSKPSWNIYASAGGMVEKGVYAHLDRSDKLAVKTEMKGLQWSVNGAIGATYKLRKGVGLFFEPQFGYFFDNGQPESIRTEWPVSFGLGAGLRFNF